MSALEELVEAVQGSEKIDAGAKAVIVAFLEGAGPAVGTLTPTVLRNVMQQLTYNNREAAMASITDSLTQEQVVLLLGVTQRGMAAAADAKVSSKAAVNAIFDAMSQAALTAVTRAIISAL
ncbi:MAG: hypothetical protein FWD53_05690 [Phycisphaerales bacterium]|nr:hypothetical protein [Phycisphaerales bacterium]